LFLWLLCRLPADEFERYGNGFDTHIKCEHNMWHYLAFFLHLEDKDETEYNSHEQYVAEQFFKHKEIGFFPQKRALGLDRSDEKGVRCWYCAWWGVPHPVNGAYLSLCHIGGRAPGKGGGYAAHFGPAYGGG
jgi:hypothetical protein